MSKIYCIQTTLDKTDAE